MLSIYKFYENCVILGPVGSEFLVFFENFY